MKKVFGNTLLMLMSGTAVCYAAYGDTVSKTIDFNRLVYEPVQNMVIDVVAFVPDILGAILIVLFGWLSAKVAQEIISAFLKSIGFDGFARKIGLSTILEETKENTIAAHAWAGLLVFWMAMAISFIMALNKLRLRIASVELDNFLHFFLTVFSVGALFVLGMFFSFIVSKIVKSVAQNTSVQKPDTWANIARVAVIIFTSIVCLNEIGLPSQVMLIVVAGAFISLCITFVIAFGFGGVTWAGKVLDKTLEKKK